MLELDADTDQVSLTSLERHREDNTILTHADYEPVP
jgi:hypothetical protein